MFLCLLSCNKSVDIRKICIDKTKDELNNKGVPVLSIDTVVASKPINSTLYGSMMGGLFFNIFQKEKTKTQ